VEESEHRAIAKSLYNECWELLEQPDRTSDEDAKLLAIAFASRYHWLAAGGPEQWVISDWMVSRVAAALEHGDLSVTYAHRANDAAHEADGPDWLIASTAEGLARAYAADGQNSQRNEWNARAQRLVDVIVDEESRALIASQLSSVPQ
jgi:hypothetical protein